MTGPLLGAWLALSVDLVASGVATNHDAKWMVGCVMLGIFCAIINHRIEARR